MLAGARRARRPPAPRRPTGSARPPRAAARRPPRPPAPPPRGWWRRCRPRSSGWPPRPGSCPGSSGRPRAGARTPRPRRGRLLDEHVGDHVRQVADGRHQPVVGLGVDRLGTGAQVGDRPLEAVVEKAAGALGRRQVPARPLEQVGARVLDPGGLGAGQRVPADEALLRAAPATSASSAPLVEPTSVTTASSPLAASASRDQRRQRADRRRAEDDLGAVDRLGDRVGGAVERLPLQRALARRAGSGSKPPTSRPAAASPPGRSSRRSARRRGRRASSPAASLHRAGEPVEDHRGSLPVETGIGDRLAVGERRPEPRSWRPATMNDSSMTPTIARLPAETCAGDLVRRRHLAVGVLAAVAVGGVDHQPLAQARRAKQLDRARRRRRRRSSARRPRRGGSRGHRGFPPCRGSPEPPRHRCPRTRAGRPRRGRRRPRLARCRRFGS